MSDFEYEADPFAPKKKKEEEVHIDFTPMIDCMFLLLMFNMFMFVIAGSKDFDIPQAKHAKGADAHDAITLVLRSPEEPGAPAKMMIKANAKEDNVADATKDDIRSILDKQFRAGKNVVVIKAEKKVQIRDVMEVAQIVGAYKDPELLIAVQHAEP
jgi:biopolymer transport protein ExbD